MNDFYDVLIDAQIDWDEVTGRLSKLESDCKTSWDHLRMIAKHDSNMTAKAHNYKYVTFTYLILPDDIRESISHYNRIFI